jgi:hypothetical protein
MPFVVSRVMYGYTDILSHDGTIVFFVVHTIKKSTWQGILLMPRRLV